MSYFGKVVKVSDNLLQVTKPFVFHKNCWHGELYFGTKIEVPPPPKRPLTAYMIFCKENRKSLVKENPTLSSPEQIKKLAEKWSHLTIDMKKPYEVSARESTLLYGELHKKFYENLTDEQKEELARLKAEKKEARRLFKLKKALRDSGVPKSPSSAYAHFVQSEAKKKEHSVHHGSEFIKKVAEMWKNLPEKDKAEFEDQAQADKQRFVVEISEWRARMISEGKSDLLQTFEELKKRGKNLDVDELSPSKKKSAAAKKFTEPPKN